MYTLLPSASNCCLSSHVLLVCVLYDVTVNSIILPCCCSVCDDLGQIPEVKLMCHDLTRSNGKPHTTVQSHSNAYFGNEYCMCKTSV